MRCRGGCYTRRSTRSASASPTTPSQALLTELGEPLLSSTLLIPGEEEPLTQGWDIKEQLDTVVDGVLDAGDCGIEPTSVLDLSGDVPVVVREGAGDVSRFLDRVG